MNMSMCLFPEDSLDRQLGEHELHDLADLTKLSHAGVDGDFCGNFLLFCDEA